MKPWRLLTGAMLALCFGAGAHAARADASTPSTALLVAGQYVAQASDCAACHTVPGGKPFAGGLPMSTPLGLVYTSNITPDKDHGIGDWSYEDFVRLMRQGIAKDGSAVYPAMPYPSYARMSDADLKSLFAYVMYRVQPVDEGVPSNTIPWPLSMRWPLRIWGWMFGPSDVAAASQDLSQPVEDNQQQALLARGAYLVEGPGHCGACHTGRGFAYQEKALTASSGAYLAGGGPLDGWIAPSLRADDLDGLGRWSEEDIVVFLKTGRNNHGAVFGGMSDVVVDSTQYMTNSDLKAIALYLKSLPPSGGRPPFTYSPAQAQALYAGNVSAPGAQIYVDRCAGCHATNGKGYPQTFPPLAGNPVLQGGDPAPIIRIVLSGSRLPATARAPSALVMAPYAGILTDQQIADVVSYVQTSWGNQGGTATSDQVAKVRKTARPVPDAPQPLQQPPRISANQ